MAAVWRTVQVIVAVAGYAVGIVLAIVAARSTDHPNPILWIAAAILLALATWCGWLFWAALFPQLGGLPLVLTGFFLVLMFSAWGAEMYAGCFSSPSRTCPDNAYFEWHVVAIVLGGITVWVGARMTGGRFAHWLVYGLAVLAILWGVLS
jgi:hypothetical protein